MLGVAPLELHGEDALVGLGGGVVLGGVVAVVVDVALLFDNAVESVRQFHNARFGQLVVRFFFKGIAVLEESECICGRSDPTFVSSVETIFLVWRARKCYLFFEFTRR